MLSKDAKKVLLDLARKTVAQYVTDETVYAFRQPDKIPELNEACGAFVTIHNNGRLRGCIGMIQTEEPLHRTITEMAVAASTEDPRFEPVSADELPEIDIEISVLSRPERVRSADEVELGKHGVIVKSGRHSGVFLPQVATETKWDKKTFMEQLCSGKAGLAPDAYLKPDTEIYVFTAEVFGEKEHHE